MDVVEGAGPYHVTYVCCLLSTFSSFLSLYLGLRKHKHPGGVLCTNCYQQADRCRHGPCLYTTGQEEAEPHSVCLIVADALKGV